ncbi:MAG: ribosome biogenesis GTPase Der [Gammaproteobacteria bacterium]|nr:ribosome biogenesis GTPase Der [Gammaproteobacteria bacterium]
MLPVIALVGRPNVGKSTLFNKLTRSRDALVADFPGLTRDRIYGFGKLGHIPYIVIDTGGIAGGEQGIDEAMAEQTKIALQEADIAIVMVDGRSGLTSADEYVANLSRRHAKQTWLVVNKTEGLDASIANSEFHALGLGQPSAISATHGDHIGKLMESILSSLESKGDLNFSHEEIEKENFEESLEEVDENQALKIAVIGRPNVGKSTLINRLIGEDRLVVFDEPGTTRDSVSVEFERNEKKYILTDTAGIRRKARVNEAIEKFSIIKALQAIEKADVVISVLDAHEGVTEQDVSLLGLVVERGRALVVTVNKWDGISSDSRKKVRDDLERRLPFLEFADRIMISALHGTAVGDLLPIVRRAYTAAMRGMSTTELSQELKSAVIAHPTPLVRGRRIKLRYAHQGGRNPPIIVIHGNQTDYLPESYRRYLVNRFRKVFKLKGTPVRLVFKKSKNPYSGRRNKLTPRQQRKRERLIKKDRKR